MAHDYRLPTLYCDGLLRALEMPPVSCCDSCHEDDAEGYDMCHYDLPDGRSAYTCCRVMIAAEESGKIEK